MDYIREFTTKLQSLDKSKSISTVFNDFTALAQCSLAQPFYRSPNIEQRYKYIISHYNQEQAEEFSKLLALLVLGLEEKHQDFLGQVYSELNLGNSNKGQFFTPYHVSKMMAQINFVELKGEIDSKGFITLSEPCCGSGGMIIAYAETMKEKGYNYQHQLYVEAVDIDEICFKMAYIQLSLLGIPAKLIRGDSLAMRYFEVYYTPFYFLSNFEYKLNRLKEENNVIPKPERAQQLTLFNYLWKYIDEEGKYEKANFFKA